MDKATIEVLARRAGLDKALAEFPEDVAAAAEQASGAVSAMSASIPELSCGPQVITRDGKPSTRGRRTFCASHEGPETKRCRRVVRPSRRALRRLLRMR